MCLVLQNILNIIAGFILVKKKQTQKIKTKNCSVCFNHVNISSLFQFNSEMNISWITKSVLFVQHWNTEANKTLSLLARISVESKTNWYINAPQHQVMSTKLKIWPRHRCGDSRLICLMADLMLEDSLKVKPDRALPKSQEGTTAVHAERAAFRGPIRVV